MKFNKSNPFYNVFIDGREVILQFSHTNQPNQIPQTVKNILISSGDIKLMEQPLESINTEASAAERSA